ncbi:MAG TPA: type II secretion system ATPase GspE [Gemmataceae bacterium]
MDLLHKLIRQGVLNEADLPKIEQAVAAQPDRALHETLIDRGFAREEPVLRALAEEFGLELIDLAAVELDPAALTAVPLKLIHRRNLMPLARENGTLTVATGNPYDVYALDELQTVTGLEILPVLASPREITRLIRTHFGVGGETVSALMEEKAAASGGVELLEDIEADDSELAKQAQEASVVRLVNEILLEAINERASDIHIEPEEHGLRIRYRIDGLLQTQRTHAEINRFQLAIISRLKIMAHLNIAEKRLPQDGRIKLRVGGREVDVRVSIIPMIHGEGVVLRLLDKGRMVFDLSSVGMLPEVYSQFQQLIDRPHGIILVTGPTGSGKSTTLYSALNEIKDESTKIITVEDPVEYHQPGISQIQVHAKIGLTFAHCLRSILRHDPDVILIGEIRDLETAENAIQASLTGHLVFSTLHTNDSASAFTRLIDMGVEPFLVASTVEGVMAQRLVRTICPDCKTPYKPELSELPVDFPLAGGTNGPPPVLYRGAGCRACRQTGYRGRTGIHELLVINDLLKEMIVQRLNAGAIRGEALRAGLVTLRQDGFRKVQMGITTLEEVSRVTAGDIS